MFTFYISTVIIWMMIIACMLIIFQNSIIRNGWMGYGTHDIQINPLILLFVISAIPLFRFSIAAVMVYMATHTVEQFEEWQERSKEND